VPNCNIGDVVEVWLTWTGANTGTLQVFSSAWVNTNYIGTGDALKTAARFYSGLGTNAAAPHWQLSCTHIELTGFYLVQGANVNFQAYDAFRNYGVLDLLRGVIDLYNLSIQTDPINKVVMIEPTDGYTLPDGSTGTGYYNDNKLDWNDKQDVSLNNEMKLFCDAPRLFDFQYAQDGNDGGINTYIARYKGFYPLRSDYDGEGVAKGFKSIVPGAARYVFPSRFQVGHKAQTNRFFTPLLHYFATEFTNASTQVSGHNYDAIAPQLPVILPASNNPTSAGSYAETFAPKIAYYKGLVSPADYGTLWYSPDYDSSQLINPDTGSGLLYPALPQNPATTGSTSALPLLPMMFAVNYMQHGSSDPVLTYCNQYLDGQVVAGLMQRFFLRRLARMRGGRQYKAYCHLTLNDVCNWWHKEGIMLRGSQWRIIGIDKYNPITNQSCEVLLWKDEYPTDEDKARSYPSDDSVTNMPSILGLWDMRYAPMLLWGVEVG